MTRPIIPWMGGKKRLAKKIIPNFPEHECYVEPFAGGAAIFFLKPPSAVEVINDINSDLVNLYRVVRHHLNEFTFQFRTSLCSREMFEWLKDTPVHTLTDIQRAARFFYLQKLGFGGKLNSTFGTATTAPPKLNLTRIEEDLSAAHLRLQRVYVEHLSWDACIAKYDRPHTFFYCDPPYWHTAGYECEFGFEHYIKMAAMAKAIAGKMIISINDHPDIRELFSGMRCEEMSIKYTVGGSKEGRKESRELLIYSW
ncbi:DNA adenine methylase [Chrysiogenes arsenatis]|uniref:DNA adenine methylase n=1 Tax=Chrysiogenes arsenatis TaxID=309797 RepID=UPI00040C8FF1|nr:DNA adenine methylase [Chrysiogenes arsenatis]